MLCYIHRHSWSNCSRIAVGHHGKSVLGLYTPFLPFVIVEGWGCVFVYRRCRTAFVRQTPRLHCICVCVCVDGVLQALLRFVHPASSCAFLRVHSDRLLQRISPAVHTTGKVTAGLAILDALVSVEAPVIASFCSICAREDRSNRYFLPCRHEFHVHCLKAWVEAGHDTCPGCHSTILGLDPSMLA